MSSWTAVSSAMDNISAPRAAATTSATAAAASSVTSLDMRVGLGLQGLVALQHDWATLTASLPDASYHHAYEWHLSYLRNLDQSSETIHYVAYFRDGNPVAIFPLRRIRRTVALVPLWVWEFPFNPHINLCDCLISPQESATDLLHLLIATLNRPTALPWDALHLPNLIDDSMALKMLRHTGLPRTEVTKCDESMYFCCDDFDTAMQNSSGRFKRNLRRQGKKLEQLGAVRVSIIQDHARLKHAFQEFLRVEASGWKGAHGQGSAIALDPHRIGFYQDLMDSMAVQQRCVISLLELDGVAIAAQFGLIYGNTLHLLKIAYDEAYGADAPGSLLLHAVLKHCCASDSIKRLSLVTGPAWTIGRWNPEASDVWTGFIFNSTMGGVAAFGAKRIRSLLRPTAKAKPSTHAAARAEDVSHHSETTHRKSSKRSRFDRVPRCQLQNHLATPSLWRRVQITMLDFRQRIHQRTRWGRGRDAASASPDRLGTPSRFAPGTWVRVRTAEQVFNTLDNKKQLRGLVWVWQQWPCCGATHRVFKPVQRMLDDANHVRPISATVLLDSASCGGPDGRGGCGRECPLMFRDEWLEEVAAPEQLAAPSKQVLYATVRSAKEIKHGLDGNVSRGGLMFMPEMFQHVNRRFAIFRKVETVFEGGRYLPVSPPLYILDGLHCSGGILGNDGPCDRGCRLLWHPDWLRLETH